MKIYTLGDILKTEHLGDEKYVRVEEVERLKKEIQNAYLEGYHDGHTGIGNKFGWERSNAKRISIMQQALKEA